MSLLEPNNATIPGPECYNIADPQEKKALKTLYEFDSGP